MIGGTKYFSLLQGSLFFAFFMAQWEEYYTGELPHAMGNFGVTEMNYGLGLFAIFNSFIDRDAFWSTFMNDVIPDSVAKTIAIPEQILDMELRHFGLIGWFSIEIFLIVGSLYRVLTNERVLKHRTHFSAISKLLTPALIAFSPFLLPKEIIENETRYISICTGLLFSFLTKKMICFSMAKMAYAAIQVDAIPYWAVFLWIRYDTNITGRGATVLLGALCVWYAVRMTNWARIAINQICTRLDIHCFTIKEKTVEDPNAWKKVS